MGTITAPGKLVWAALPNGRSRSDGRSVDDLHLSALLSPRLVPAGTGASVDSGQFPGLADWPKTASGLAFTIEFDTGPDTPIASVAATLDPAPLDSKTWTGLMASLPVKGHQPSAPELGSAKCVSYPAVRNYANVVAGYRPDPSVLPQAPLAGAATAGDSPARRLAALVGRTETERAQIRATLQQLQAQHGTVSPRHIVEASGIAPELLLFDQAASFFDRLSEGARKRHEQSLITPPSRPSFDAHTAITAYARYPLLMRRLGLVLDLVCPFSTGLPALGRIRIKPAKLPAGWTVAAPWTLYALDATGFTARPDPANPFPPGIARGVIAPRDSDAPLGLDLDPLVHGIRAMAVQVHSQAAPGAAAADPQPPAPRSAGLALARDGLNDVVDQMLARQAGHEADLATAADGSSVALGAEDLMRGFRVDIRRVGESAWHSLNRRRGTYRLADNTPLFAVAQDDEGCATLRVFNPEPIGTAVWTHEALFRWTGWSLSVPKPGRTVAPDGGLMDGTPGGTTGPAAGDLPLRVRFDPVPGTLPMLRFGAAYECRLRVVDLAGNGLDPTAPSGDADIFQLGRYLRFDPLLAPALALRDPAQPAESVDHIVLRSAIETPATATAERLVAPPRTSAQMAEWHGSFDVAARLDPDAYARIVAHEGDFADAPYGGSPPALPYLPDPLARGANLSLLTPPGAPQPAPIRVPFDGVWPALLPFRLVLAEGAADPAWDAARRVLTVSLPKGRTLSMALTTYLDAGHLDLTDPTRDDVKDVALFDYWDHILNNKNLVKRRDLYWKRIVQGGNPQLTPARTITLVHAVAKPLVAPLLDATRLVAGRKPDSTAATLAATTPLDVPSTGQVEMLMQWDEPIDDGVNAPYRIAASANLPRMSLDYPPAIQAGDSTLAFQHEFHDTRHRRVTCQLVAATRYREHFPEITDTAKLTQVSPKATIEVPSSARPLPPKVLSLVPIFAWEDAGAAAAPARRRRTGLRVYLDRPWYSSGDGEMLGVVMPIREIEEAVIDTGPGPGPRPTRPVQPPDPGVTLVDDPPTAFNSRLVPFVTQWGTDPLFLGAPVASSLTPLPKHFANVKAKVFLFTPPLSAFDARHWDRVVAAFDVEFDPPDPTQPARAANPQRDPHNGRWYCDLELAAGTAYMPFIRLALVRVQPNASPADFFLWPDGRVSDVVLADFAQLAPDRSASVVPDPVNAGRISVTVSGPSYADNTATDATARPAPIVTVDTQIDIGEPAMPVWISTGSTELARVPGDPTASRWQGSVVLPVARATRPLRLLLREYERLPADSPARDDIDATTVVIARRLVYADVLPL